MSSLGIYFYQVPYNSGHTWIVKDYSITYSIFYIFSPNSNSSAYMKTYIFYVDKASAHEKIIAKIYSTIKETNNWIDYTCI